jgi:hypothetical protein
MSIFNDKALKGVAAAVSKIMDEELKGNQHKIDANKNGKVDAHDFKLLRAKKGMKEEAEKMAKKDHDQDGKVESGKAEYLGSRIRAAKMAGKMKEETELDEAFPTVADAKKRMDAGKTSTGSVTKTKTGLVHKRDHDKDDAASDTQKKSTKYGARQSFERSSRVNEKPGKYKKTEKRPDDRSKIDTKSYKVTDGAAKALDMMRGSLKEERLSFTEMLHLYNESGVEVISKIVPQTVKFGDTEVELIDANIVNGAVGITVAEEVDNETFTKEVEAQKEKNAGRGKKAEVAKASVQAVKQEEYEQIDEISKETAGKYLTAPQGKGANKYKVSHDKASYPDYETMTKHATNVRRALQRSGGQAIYKKPDYYKEEEQLDELSKGTLGSYIKKASHDVAAKGAFTRHFADKSRAETAAQRPDLARLTMKKADKMQDAGMKRRANMAKAVDRLTKEEVQMDERTLTAAETKEKEKNVKGMKKSLSGFKARYGDDAKSVMYATATSMAKKD